MRSRIAVPRDKWSDRHGRMATGKRFRWSGADLWAWLDLNQRPHPYQQNARNRCAKRRSRRSRSTVEGEVMCSQSVQLCGLLTSFLLPICAPIPA